MRLSVFLIEHFFHNVRVIRHDAIRADFNELPDTVFIVDRPVLHSDVSFMQRFDEPLGCEIKITGAHWDFNRRVFVHWNQPVQEQLMRKDEVACCFGW
ncbi:hypothetical protein QFZ72_005433 [Bacillus sp. V2I10]|nr:hypothetical protein [Bacillus sp. V2I10]